MCGADIRVPVYRIKDSLPPWIDSCIVYICPSKYSTGMGWVEPENIKYKNGKVLAEIYINDRFIESELKDILQHEIQHLYDYFKSNGRKINNKFKVNPGHDEPDEPIVAICHGNLEWNVILELFKYYTDFCHEFEWTAYLRNFNSYLKTVTKKISYDDIPNESGKLPLFIHKLFNILLTKVDDITDQNIEDILYYLDHGYLKKTKIKSFLNLKDHDRLKAIIEWMLNIDMKKMINKYKRCLKDNNIKYSEDIFDNTITVGLKTKVYI